MKTRKCKACRKNLPKKNKEFCNLRERSRYFRQRKSSVCVVCHTKKPIAEFYLRKAMKLPYRRCRSCQNASSRAWQKKNPDKHRENCRKAGLKFYYRNRPRLLRLRRERHHAMAA